MIKKIRVLTLEEDNFKPFIVTFPHNHPSQRFLAGEDDEDDENVIEFDYYQHNQAKKKLMVHGHNSKFDWLGTDGGRVQEKNRGTKFVLGFYKEDSKNITLVEAEHAFNLYQHFKDEKLEDEENENKGQIKFFEQKNLLVQEFGNTRSKKMMDAYKTGIVTESKISEANEMRNILLEKAKEFQKTMAENKEDPIHALIQSKREMFPEFDLEATKPEKIYSFFSVIPREDFEAIDPKGMIGSIKQDATFEKNKKFYTKYVLQEVEDIRSKKRTFPENASYNSKIKCLIYLNWLLKFLDMRVVSKPIEQICEDMRMQQNQVKTILSRFFIASNEEQDKVVYKKNTNLTDKLICYILILALFYSDFKLDATALLANLKLENQKFIKYAEEVGCSVSKKKEEGVAKLILELKAPLKIKEPPVKRQKGKK